MNSNRKILLSTLFIAILVVIASGITFAFFNYTRTGIANRISVGRIAFNTIQSSGQNGSINLTNVFPVDVSEGVPSNNPNVGEVTINITGDTEYTGGIEYIVTAANVTNTIGGKTIPIGVNVTATSGLGTSDEDYFDDRENNPATSIYKVLAEDAITNNEELLVGYIKSGETGVNGNVVVKAYLDASKVAISDTYYENVTATPTPTAPTDEYGTPASFGEGRVVLTTEEWNSLRTNGISFQVKVEAREDIWVEEAVSMTASEYVLANATLETTSYGKIYSGATPANYVTFNNESWRIIGVYTDAVNGDMLKIIKATPFDNKQAYGTDGSSCNRTWAGTTLETTLNGTYYTSLSSDIQSMIADGIWNVHYLHTSGSTNCPDEKASDAYNDSIESQITRKVGLVATYEYLYAAGNSCWNNSGDYPGFVNTSCSDNDWLHETLTNNGIDNAWTISYSSACYNPVQLLYFPKILTYASADISNYVSPVVYLKPGVVINGGDGMSTSTAYTLSYTAE